MEVKRTQYLNMKSSNYFYSPSGICNSLSVRSFHFVFSSLTTECAVLPLWIFLSVCPHSFAWTIPFSPAKASEKMMAMTVQVPHSFHSGRV